MKHFLIIFIAFLYSLLCGTGSAELLGKKFILPSYDGSPAQLGFQTKLPKILGNKALAEKGYVDITAPPFSADPTGRRDSTKAIQAAVNFARDNQMVTFFPSGVYLVSDTITCLQDYIQLSDDTVLHARKHPCVLVGSREGPRPMIRLAPNSPGFGNPDQKKYVVHYWARLVSEAKKEPQQPNMSMNQVFINIDIEIGHDNPGAVGLRHRGAEGCTVQECTIDATHGHTGFEGGIGSGGSIADLTVRGGIYGLDMRETQPAPTITGIKLINQTKAAIVYGGRQSLSAVGVEIRAKSTGPVIIGAPIWRGPHHGQICLVDSTIVFEKRAGTAIATPASLYLENVYVENAETIVQAKGVAGLAGKPSKIVQVKQYAYGVDPKEWLGYRFEMPVYLEGKRSRTVVKDVVDADKLLDEMQLRHLWLPSMNVGFESHGAANVKDAPYNAQGDGATDDTTALQKAVDENELVFLPKGYYRLTQPLKLKPNTKITGVAKHLSVLIVTGPDGLFSNPVSPAPMVTTAQTSNASTLLSFLEIMAPSPAVGAYALRWRVGGDSVVRDVNFRNRFLKGKADREGRRMDFPLVLIDVYGGGKWYNLNIGSHFNQGVNYRHLLIKNSKSPLVFYQYSLQHAESESNLEINNSENITFFGVKGESKSAPIILAKNSRHIKVIGYGGNAYAKSNGALFTFRDCEDLLLSNIVDTPVWFKQKKGPAWYMILDEHKETVFKTQQFDRPVLYRSHFSSPDNVKNFHIE